MGGRFALVIGALLGALAVGAGAFGAHSLDTPEMRERFSLDDEDFKNFETAVRYQLVHALALLATGLVGLTTRRTGWSGVACFCFFVGVVLFSGSIYVLVFEGPRWVWPLTPIGGVLLILGWLALSIAGCGCLSAKPTEAPTATTAPVESRAIASTAPEPNEEGGQWRVGP